MNSETRDKVREALLTALRDWTYGRDQNVYDRIDEALALLDAEPVDAVLVPLMTEAECREKFEDTYRPRYATYADRNLLWDGWRACARAMGVVK